MPLYKVDWMLNGTFWSKYNYLTEQVVDHFIYS